MAAARRRRRRRGGGTAAPVASGPCPLHAVKDPGPLRERWDPLARALRELVGDSQFEIWLAPAHLHVAGPVLELGFPPTTLGWVSDRFGRAIAQAAGSQVQLVPCDAAGVSA